MKVSWIVSICFFALLGFSERALAMIDLEEDKIAEESLSLKTSPKKKIESKIDFDGLRLRLNQKILPPISGTLKYDSVENTYYYGQSMKEVACQEREQSGFSPLVPDDEVGVIYTLFPKTNPSVKEENIDEDIINIEDTYYYGQSMKEVFCQEREQSGFLPVVLTDDEVGAIYTLFPKTSLSVEEENIDEEDIINIGQNQGVATDRTETGKITLRETTKQEINYQNFISQETGQSGDENNSTNSIILPIIMNPPNVEFLLKVEDPAVWPWHVHGHLYIKFGEGIGHVKIGSGILIGKRSVLTAAHNLYSIEYDLPASEAYFYPGKNGDNETAQYSAFADRIAIHPNFKNAKKIYGPNINEAKENAKSSDIGLIRLDRELGLGAFAYGTLDLATIYANLAINLAGYPANEHNGKFLFAKKGLQIKDFSNNRIYYAAETCGGYSGGGIWIEGEDPDLDEKDRYTCIGVHAYGNGPNGSNGVFIDDEKSNRIEKWKQHYGDYDE